MSNTPRRATADLFIRHPVIAAVVNLAIVLVGWRALASLPVQQYPKIESSSVVITTVYYGASAETVRGFLPTPLDGAGVATPDRRSVEKFAHLIVADRAGAIVRLRDVARVELGAEEADLIAKYNESEGVYLGVWPLVGANEIEVANRLRAEMDRIRPSLPKDIEMRLVWDGTMFMRDALEEITKTLIETMLIVGLAVFLFMGSIRTALVPLIAMPVSLIGAAVVMYAFGFSLNLLTMLAIVLAVGLVVDDGIVVVENVERHVRMGKTRIEAALIGARELLGPIIAMTITLAVVYAPIGFQGGLTGALFLEFAITLAAAVLVSGFVAVTLSPVMSSRFVHEHGEEGRLTRLVNRGFDKVR